MKPKNGNEGKVRSLRMMMSVAAAMALVLGSVRTGAAQDVRIPADEVPLQLDGPGLSAFMEEAGKYVRVEDARARFKVDGKGIAVAVLDTGLRVTHEDFAGRVPVARNFTTDDGGDPANVRDGNGHGTNVAGIIGAKKEHRGVAPGASVIPLKVLRDDGGGDFAGIAAALDWVHEHHRQYGIGVVNMSLGDPRNLDKEPNDGDGGLSGKIAQLRADGVAVVVAAGNGYFGDQKQGMAYPAILRSTVSVGAVYDGPGGPVKYQSGAEAYRRNEGQLTPFSQRLHVSVAPGLATDVFAPGAPIRSTGTNDDRSSSIQSGTSQAAPVVAGVILLMQELYRRDAGRMPSVDDIEAWLRQSAMTVVDAGSDAAGKYDNVDHTNLAFGVVDAVKALEVVNRDLMVDFLQKNSLLK